MTRNGNYNGSGTVSPGSMDAFDKLPKSLRVVLANCDHNWNGEQLQRVRSNRKHASYHKVRTVTLCIAFLRASDKAKHETDAALGLIMPGQR
jgi:hypothetical protein